MYAKNKAWKCEINFSKIENNVLFIFLHVIFYRIKIIELESFVFLQV